MKAAAQITPNNEMQGCIVKQKVDGNHPHFISPYSNWET